MARYHYKKFSIQVKAGAIWKIWKLKSGFKTNVSHDAIFVSYSLFSLFFMQQCFNLCIQCKPESTGNISYVELKYTIQ